MAFPIYIQADTADFDGPLDLRRSAVPEFWAGSAVEFRIGIFEFGTIRDVSDLASITVEIKAKTSKDEAPAPGAAPLMAKTVTSLDNATTEAEWYAYTHCHATIVFTAEESAIPAGTHWLVVTAQTRGTASQTLTLCAGDIVVSEDGHGVVGEVPVENGQAYTKAASDARYARIAEGGALYVDASAGDDATAVPGRADRPHATLAAAFGAAEVGDCVLVMPGTYAPATLSKALRVGFSPGVKLEGSLVLAASGARLSGVLEVGSCAAYSITASSAVSAGIDGTLSVNKPVAASVTLSGGVLVDGSASAFLHPGLTGNEDSLALPRVVAMESALSAESAILSAHRSNLSNPHAVTKAQVGLGNADNTADIDKPLSSAAQTALAGKAALAGSSTQAFNASTLTTASSVICGGNISCSGWLNAATLNASGAISGANLSASGWIYTTANHSGYTVPSLTASILARNLGGDNEIDLVAARTTTGLTGGVRFYDSVSGTSTLLLKVTNGALVGGSANTLNIGTSSVPCAGGYTQTAFVVTSALEAKTAIRDFSAAEKAVAKEIVLGCPRAYQLVTSVAEKGADAARLHSGCIYEEVRRVFVDGGLDPERYSIFCASPRPKKEARTEMREVITVIDGKAVVTTETVTIKEPVFEELPMVDAAGNALLDEAGKPRTHWAPVYETDETGAVFQDKGLRYEELQIWIAVGLRELAVEK